MFDKSQDALVNIANLSSIGSDSQLCLVFSAESIADFIVCSSAQWYLHNSWLWSLGIIWVDMLPVYISLPFTMHGISGHWERIFDRASFSSLRSGEPGA